MTNAEGKVYWNCDPIIQIGIEEYQPMEGTIRNFQFR